VKTEELYRLQAMEERTRVAYRWLSGFEDLDILWSYVFGTSRLGYIDAVRIEYAKARSCDVYGKPRENN
jgi:hypothetical protein